jgi:WD40 repeat protein
VDRLQFTPNDKYLFAVIGHKKGLFRFHLNKDETSPGLRGEFPHYLGFSADGETWLEFYNGGRTLLLRPNAWTRGAVEYETVKYEAAVTHAVFSADDKWLAVATADGTVHVHERASLREVHALDTKQRTVTAVAFAPDGKRLAVVGHEAVGRVFDAEKGTEVAALKGHGGIVFAVAFSPDGKWAATGGDDTTARVWDAATGKEQAVLRGHRDSVNGVAFGADGVTLLTASADRTVRTWKLGGR